MWPEQEQEGILSGVEPNHRLPDAAIKKNPKTCRARFTHGERPGGAASIDATRPCAANDTRSSRVG